jgi:dTDP-4-amino-4,6-dideoxygalactose transaminase
MVTPFLDIKAQYAELRSMIDDAVASVLASGSYILGEEVESFEASYANFCECSHAVGVANGLDALYLSLRALDIGTGDEVLVPSHTFVATWLAIHNCGATIVPIEPADNNYLMDVHALETAITERTKAIIPVHLYGHPIDISPILEIRERYGLKIIEDAAQAHGAKYKGKRIGGHGDLVAWSFYPGKNLGAFGDAGAITTNNEALAKKIKSLRNYGSRQKYEHSYFGVNSRLDPVQAAVLKVKLQHLDNWNQRRQSVADLYLSEIRNSQVSLPQVASWANPAWHLFVIRHPRRDELQGFLRQAGIETLIHYPIAPHMQACFRGLFKNQRFQVAEQLASQVLSLPIGPHLTLEDAHTVASLVNDFG